MKLLTFWEAEEVEAFISPAFAVVGSLGEVEGGTCFVSNHSASSAIVISVPFNYCSN